MKDVRGSFVTRLNRDFRPKWRRIVTHEGVSVIGLQNTLPDMQTAEVQGKPCDLGALIDQILVKEPDIVYLVDPRVEIPVWRTNIKRSQFTALPFILDWIIFDDSTGGKASLPGLFLAPSLLLLT